MDTGARTFLVVGFGIIGLAPLVLVVFWARELRRRRRAPGGPGAVQGGWRFGRFEIGFVVVALVALTAGSYALVQRNPEFRQEEDHSQHEEAPENVAGGGAGNPAPVSASASQDQLPPTLAGIPLNELAVGAEALEQVSHLHQGAEIEVQSAAVARYAGSGGRAELWVSRSADADAASRLAADMARRMESGNSPFEPPAPVEGEAMMWETRGMGQVHHFWSAGTGVWWLSVDEALLPAAMGEAGALSVA